MNFNKMFKLIVASTALIFTTIGFSHSASMPCGTAKLIVPWGAGGGTDVIFRQMVDKINKNCLLYTSPSPRDDISSRMPSSA